MREGEEMKDLDRFVAEAIIDGIKKDHTSINPQNNKRRTQLSSSLGVEEKKPGPKTLPKIRTFSYDAQNAIEKSNAPKARLYASRDKEQKVRGRKGSAHPFFPILLLLIIIALIGIYIAYNYTSTIEPVEIVSTPTKKVALIDYDNTVEFNESSIEKILDQTPYKEGVTYIVSENLSLQNIITTHFIHIPNLLARNLLPEFMMGVIKRDEVTASFIILKSTYKFALPGMQSWESNLTKDLISILSLPDTEPDVFLDIPHQEALVRTNGLIGYALTKNGEIILTNNLLILDEIISKL